ncbi:MAG: adenylate/guanylate cyclase domain-containing protein [Campylobacterota bacterium]|nr:adenylate/guanylate cyclase domain-containing protein [Campylobacterota bacterium]
MNKRVIISIMLFVYLGGVVLNTIYQHKHNEAEVLKSIDRQLGWAASGTSVILGDGFHNIVSLDKLGKEEYFKIMRQISRYNDEMGTAYVYSFVKREDKVVFASTSYQANEWADNKYADDFLQEYKDATDLLKATFLNEKISFEESSDQWGTFRSILIPYKSNDGTTYVIGADLDISDVKTKLQHSLFLSILEAIYYLMLLLPIGYLYSRSLQKDKENLEKTIKIRTKELNESHERLDSISQNLSKYLSPQIKDMIFNDSHQSEIKSKRKKLTICFTDIKDFTSTTEKMEPEEITNVLNDYFQEMNKIALEYNGTIDKFIGDSILIFMGDPVSHGEKEDAYSAVKMAIDMRERMKQLRTRWFEEGMEYPFRVRIGINTGYCTVGNFGSDSKMDYTIIGSPVNLASRLESLADIDEILIAYETYALVRDKIECEVKEAISVKGFANKVKTYRVVDTKEKFNIERNIVLDGENYKVELDISKMSYQQRTQLREKLQTIHNML